MFCLYNTMKSVAENEKSIFQHGIDFKINCMKYIFVNKAYYRFDWKMLPIYLLLLYYGVK